MKTKMVPKNVRVKIGRSVLTLVDHHSRVKTIDGVEVYLKERPGLFQPIAVIPDGLLPKYIHHRPIILSCDWEEIEY